MNVINSFDKPDQVVPRTFDGARVGAEGLTVELPPKSVVVLDLK
jgi:alpha-N-arabinofuranosidase